jgi:hypothetical protein
MQIAVSPRIVAGIASLGLLTAIALTTPGVASAATLTCRGHTQVGTASEDFDNPLDYSFGCTGRIVGFMIVTSHEISGFTNDVEVHDAAGTLIPADGFQCEGDIPGEGFGCAGSYTPNGTVKGTFDVSERAACAEPRIDATLVVVAETIDPVTGVAKKTSTGAMGGPFDFGRPHGCPKSSLISGLLAELALVRGMLKSGS